MQDGEETQSEGEPGVVELPCAGERLVMIRVDCSVPSGRTLYVDQTSANPTEFQPPVQLRARLPERKQTAPTCCARLPESKQIAPTCCARLPESKQIAPTCCARLPESKQIAPTCCARLPESKQTAPTCCARLAESKQIAPTCCALSEREIWPIERQPRGRSPDVLEARDSVGGAGGTSEVRGRSDHMKRSRTSLSPAPVCSWGKRFASRFRLSSLQISANPTEFQPLGPSGDSSGSMSRSCNGGVGVEAQSFEADACNPGKDSGIGVYGAKVVECLPEPKPKAIILEDLPEQCPRSVFLACVTAELEILRDRIGEGSKAVAGNRLKDSVDEGWVSEHLELGEDMGFVDSCVF